MKFHNDSSIDGPLVHGYESGDHWDKNGGHYHTGRDFFWVHWEISQAKPLNVKFHVECPKAEIDPVLSDIKQALVDEFLKPRFEDIAEKNGLAYKRGNRTKAEHVKRYKCTAPFQVILSPKQSRGGHEANIEMVGELFSEAVATVVDRHRAKLNRYFGK